MRLKECKIKRKTVAKPEDNEIRKDNTQKAGMRDRNNKMKDRQTKSHPLNLSFPSVAPTFNRRYP